MKGVYLLHYDSCFGHARHYLGASSDIAQRINCHKNGNGGRLPTMFYKAGINFQIARIWKTETKAEAFELESKLKRRSVHNGKRSGSKNNTVLCPICQGGRPDARTTRFQKRFSPSST